MEVKDKYQLVKNVEFHSQKNVTFSVRNPLLYKDSTPKYVQFFVVFLLIIGAATIIDFSVMLMIEGSIGAGLYMIWPVPLFAILMKIQNNKVAKLGELKMNFDPKLSYLEFESNLIGQKQFLRHPNQLKIVVRYFPEHGDRLLWFPDHKTSGIKVVSVEVIGLGSNVDSLKVSKEIVATFKFGSLKDAQEKLNEAQSSFEFLADWLKVPIVIEEHVLYEDSDIRYYF